jgi:hypothetical protein
MIILPAQHSGSVNLFGILVIGLSSSLAFSGCASVKQIESSPVTTDVVIDGSAEDWAGVLRLFEGESGVSIGVRNNAEALYVVLVVRDQAKLRQIMRAGLSLWFDPEGGKDRVFGIGYPLRPEGMDRSGLGGMPRGMPGGGSGGMGDREEMEAAMRERFVESLDELQVLHDGEERGMQLPANSASGIRTAGSFEYGELVLEYRIPLGDSESAVYELPPVSEELGFGLISPEIEMPTGARPAGGGGRGGMGGGGRGSSGGGGRGTRGGGGRGGSGRSGMTRQNEPIDTWARVALVPTGQ